MKIRIKTYNGELPSYLTSGLGYEIEHINNEGKYFIYKEQIEYVCVTLSDCKHLNGGSWEIVE